MPLVVRKEPEKKYTIGQVLSRPTTPVHQATLGVAQAPTQPRLTVAPPKTQPMITSKPTSFTLSADKAKSILSRPSLGNKSSTRSQASPKDYSLNRFEPYNVAKDATKAFFADPKEQTKLIGAGGLKPTTRQFVVGAAATLGLDMGAGKIDDALRGGKKVLSKLTRFGKADEVSDVSKFKNKIQREALQDHWQLTQRAKLNTTDKTAIRGFEKAQALTEKTVSNLGTQTKKAKYLKDDFGKFMGSEAGFHKVPNREELASATQGFRTQMIDRFAAIDDFTKGKNLLKSEDPYVAARNFAGHFGRVENRLDDLSGILRPARKELKSLKEYAKMERFEELAGRGITKLEGGQTIEQVREAKKALEAKLGPKKLAKVQESIKKLRAYSDNLLSRAKNAGLISEESYKGIKAKNQKYIPLQRVEFIADKLDEMPRGSNAFSVARQDIVKSIKGSKKEVVDPIESIIRNTYKTETLIARNEVALKMADLSKREEFKDLVLKIETHPTTITKTSKKGTVFKSKAWVQDVSPKGYQTISVLRNGVKETYAVPEVVAEAMKGLSPESFDIITKMATFGTRLLRQGATTLNTAFIVPNIIRDAQTATLVSKVGFGPQDWLRGFFSALRHDDLYKAYLESGASYAGYFEQGKSLKNTAKGLAATRTMKFAKTIINPLELIRKAGEVTELAPRIGVFNRSLKQGKEPIEAAFNARNATVDFARMGVKMKTLNMWVPFVNARLQGTINTFKAVKNRPVRSMAILGAMVGLPAAATYFNNTRYHEDIWDDIAQHEKDNYFIFIYGDETDEDGNPKQVVKIPKGDVGRIFGNPLEHLFAFTDKRDRQTLDQLAIKILSDISPVGFEREGKLSAEALMSSILPPTVKAGVESTTNKNLFTGFPIVPRSLEGVSPELQYKDSTSPLAKVAGKLTGMSPLKIENAVGTQFGGLGRQILHPSTVFGGVSKRFSGARGGAKEEAEHERIDELTQQGADTSLLRRREAEDLLEKYNQNPGQLMDILSGASPEVVDKFKELYKEQELGLSTVDKRIKGLGVENGARAQYIYDKIKDMPEDKALEYLSELQQKKILTDEVKKQVFTLRNQ